MSVKKQDDRIVVIAGAELKQKFKEACDGRTMSHVLIKFMNEYVESKEGDGNNG